MTTPEPDPAATEDSVGSRVARRWPLGLLTLIVVMLVAGGVWLLGGEGDGADTSARAQSGEAAPDFSVDLLDGSSFRLSEHLADDGRPVILNLWASWCHPCREEMPAFDSASQAHPDVYFIGVAVEDAPEAARAFAEEVDVSYPLAIDEAERVGDRYPSPGLPATFFISSDGEIVRKVFGQLDEDGLGQVIAESFGG